MPKITAQIEVGTRFNKLVLLEPEFLVFKNNRNFRYGRFKCDCGQIKEAKVSHVQTGTITSCGCIKKAAGNNLAHLHTTWSQEDIAYLKTNYHSQQGKDIASSLGKSIKAVFCKARDLGLEKNVKNNT